jgi:hypothetical protein
MREAKPTTVSAQSASATDNARSATNRQLTTREAQ